jgi:hypothetical protein
MELLGITALRKGFLGEIELIWGDQRCLKGDLLLQ